MYDKSNNTGFWMRTSENMFTSKCWENPEEYFKHDSCELTWEAYYTYGDNCFVEGLRNCIKKVYRKGWRKIFGEYYYQLQRWPEEYEGMVGMSRDHLIYVFAALYTSNIPKEELQEYVSHLRPVVSITWGMHMTLELWLWLKLIAKYKVGKLYYPVRLLGSFTCMWWTKLMYFLAGWGEELTWEEYKLIKWEQNNKSLKNKIFTNIIEPVYSRKLTSTKVSLLPDNWWTRNIKKLELMTTTKYNYVLRILNGDKTVKLEDIENYKSIAFYRFSDSFEPWRSVRWMSDIPEEKGNYTTNVLHINQIDRDYTLKLFKQAENENTK